MELKFNKYLSKNETILWSGKPKQGIVFRTVDWFLVPLSLILGGFPIIWECGVIIVNAPWFMVLAGIPFVLGGLYLMFGRFFVEARRREKTFYAVTNKRILIHSGLFSSTLKQLSIKTLTLITLEEKNERVGSIILGKDPISFFGGYRGSGWPNGSRWMLAPSFDLIDNAQEVYDLVLKIQNS